MTKQTQIQLPSLLAFERKLETSDALMYAGNWADISADKAKKEDASNVDENPWHPIEITKRFNRSTQSAHGISNDNKTEPNPVSSGNDDANLSQDTDTLKITFSIRVIGGLGQPFACNDPAFEQAIRAKVEASGESIKTLAFRYAYNIANGRFLWRNRVGAEKVKIKVGELNFDAYQFSLKDFEKNKDDQNLLALAELIEKGLNSQENFTLLKIEAYSKLGEGQHVFPSEEMNMEEKGKSLFKLKTTVDQHAAMHNVKIGNAIRTIDTWYGDKMLVKEDKKTVTIDIDAHIPIAIEPYGSVTQKGRAYRATKIDLYTLMIDWLNNNEISEEDKSYVIGNLIRGGVFSKKSKK